MKTVLTWIFHGIIAIIAFGIPIVLQANPSWLSLSIGTILFTLYQWAISGTTIAAVGAKKV